MGKKNELTKQEKRVWSIIEEEMKDEKDPKWEPVYINREESNYAISNLGDVINIKSGLFLKPHPSDFGYSLTKLSLDGKQYTFRNHRLVALYFIPNPDNKPEVNHIDGIKTHNWYKNLEWVTSKENKQHAIDMGLYDDASFTKVGSDRPNAVYTDEQVHAVCKLLEQGKQPKEISDILEVSVNLPGYIKYCGKWNHISSQYAIPKSGELPRRKSGLLYESKKNSHDQIHQICKLLEQGKQPKEISDILGVTKSLPMNIKSRKAWREISKDYNIPKSIVNNTPYTHKPKVIELLNSGITDYGEILRKLELPDDRVNRKYIALVKFQSKI